jgi:hypothetical protein
MEGTMATEKQIAANKRNAARSTGPRSPLGKARSRMNALRHGLSYLGAEDTAGDEAGIADGLHLIQVERTKMLGEVNALIDIAEMDSVDRIFKRVAALSRYEGRIYSSLKRRRSGD